MSSRFSLRGQALVALLTLLGAVAPASAQDADDMAAELERELERVRQALESKGD